MDYTEDIRNFTKLKFYKIKINEENGVEQLGQVGDG